MMRTSVALIFGLLSAVGASPQAAPPTAAAQEALVETSKGTFVIRLLPELAPLHVKHFVGLAKAGAFDGRTFHRVIAGGLIQGGDPLSKDPKQAARYGTGGLGVLKAEFSERPFVRGVVGAARTSLPNTAGDQFFVVLTEQVALRGKYTIFGEVTSGLEVADAISASPADGDKAKERIEMKVTLRAPAPPTAPTP